LDGTKRLLVGFVKPDNIDYFLKEESSKLYYTGNVSTFPSTIALNKLYYFMPHIKGKGVRDIYLIKIVRIGSKTEIHPEVEDTKAPRLVFELEYLESLPEYKMINLNFQRAFTDTFLGRVIKI
jgi:DNA (cytosine-5)-methyltransferase 1